jgi:hypothetical protein
MVANVAYRHVQTYRTLWLFLPMTALVLLLVGPALGGRQAEALAGFWWSLPALAGALLCLGRLVIEIDGPLLRWHFGYVGWPRWQVPLADIVQVQVTQTRALQGSGIKGSSANRLYNVTIAGPAVLLVLRDGRRVTLGSPEAERLAAFIQARLPAAR